MSGPPQVLLDLVPFVAWGTPEDVTASAANLSTLQHPFVTARSRGTASGRWQLDFAAASDVAAVWVGNANVATVTVSTSTDGYAFTTAVTAAPLGLAPATGRRQGWIAVVATSLRALRLDAGALAAEHATDTTLELGAVAVGRTVLTLSDYDAWPLESTVTVPSSTLVDADTGEVLNVNEEGRPYMEWRFTNEAYDARTAIGSDLATLAAQAPDAPFVLWLTPSDPATAWCVQRVDDVTVTRTPGRFGASFLFRECA